MIQPTNAQQLYPQAGGANAVSINIYNPTAYGSTPQNSSQAVPYNYQNSLYQMPQASAYQQQSMPNAYQQYMPMQNPVAQQTVVPQIAAPNENLQQVTSQAPVEFQPSQTASQVLESPAPQMMPESVMAQPQAQQVSIEQPQVQQAQVQQPQTEQIQTEQAQAAQAQPQVETQKAVQEVPTTINTDELIQQLKDSDSEKRANAIDKIASYAQGDPKEALQVVSEPIMNALVDIIKEDTSGLEGPSEKQIAIAEKISKGEKTTPEEDALFEQSSPRDKANINRIFALYTLAMIQKLQRDELNQYIETQKANGEQPIAPLALNDLIGFNDVVNIINNDSRPEVKVAAIQALQYVAEPQDLENVKQILADSLNSSDEAIKAVADETIAKLNGTTAQPAEIANENTKAEMAPKAEEKQTNAAA